MPPRPRKTPDAPPDTPSDPPHPTPRPRVKKTPAPRPSPRPRAKTQRELATPVDVDAPIPTVAEILAEIEASLPPYSDVTLDYPRAATPEEIRAQLRAQESGLNCPACGQKLPSI